MNEELPFRRVAVLGARGQLGSELCRQLARRAIPLSRRDLNLLELNSIARTLQALRPDAVINAAAYTQVDRAESEPEVCQVVNALAVQEIAVACRSLDCPLVQISTDYVFGGDRSRNRPYTEADEPAPLNVYGATKLAGERFAASHAKHFVVRTCGLYASPTADRRHRNFVTAMLCKSDEGRSISIVDDQWCTPTFVPNLMDGVLRLLSSDHYGTYHLVNESSTTWYQFAKAIFQELRSEIKPQPISSHEYPTPAARPRNSVLDSSKFKAVAKWRIPHWRDALGTCLAAEYSSQAGTE